MSHFIIAPSILAADLARLGEQVQSVLDAGADFVHVDVMDNHYVPNLSFGPGVVRALRNYGIQAPIDVHLMVTPVDRLIAEFAAAGATYISFHPDASEQAERTLQLIHEQGCQAGLALRPETTLDCLDNLIEHLELLLLMSVNPGFGGQAFMPSSLDKLRQARALIEARKPEVLLEVDGGVGVDNIRQIAEAGANVFVAGTAVFGSGDCRAALASLRAELAAGKPASH